MLKPYNRYKETNIPWLSEVPSHWLQNRAKNLYKKENREPLQNDEVVTCFRDGQVTLRKNRRTTGFTESIKEHGYQHINKGDLVIHVMDAFAGAVGVSDSSGKGTPVYSVCTSKVDINNYFYAYIIREMAKTGFIQSLYRGIRERSSDFRFEVFAMQLLPVPPRAEQDQIVKYLDWQTSKINTLIKAKKKQIELLKEQKQAVINKAVTKGLDDTVPMKDSGIEWLGEVPEHWVSRFLFQIAKEQGISNKGMISDNLLSLSYGRIINKNINKTDGLLPMSFETYQIVHNGNIILRLTDLQNDHKSLRVGLVTQEGIITSAYTCLKPQKNVFADFLYRLLHSYDVCKVFYGMGGGVRQSIGYKDISKIICYCPPFQEQQAIVTYLEEKTALIDKAIDVIEKEIELVSEYKTSLISSVVTGKVDVRDVVVPDFEVVEEDRPNIEFEKNEEE